MSPNQPGSRLSCLLFPRPEQDDCLPVDYGSEGESFGSAVRFWDESPRRFFNSQLKITPPLGG